MRPYAAPALLAEMSMASPGDIPADKVGKVTGSFGDAGGGTVTVSTDAGPVECTVTVAAGRFVVVSFVPATGA